MPRSRRRWHAAGIVHCTAANQDPERRRRGIKRPQARKSRYYYRDDERPSRRRFVIGTCRMRPDQVRSRRLHVRTARSSGSTAAQLQVKLLIATANPVLRESARFGERRVLSKISAQPRLCRATFQKRSCGGSPYISFVLPLDLSITNRLTYQTVG